MKSKRAHRHEINNGNIETGPQQQQEETEANGKPKEHLDTSLRKWQMVFFWFAKPREMPFSNEKGLARRLLAPYYPFRFASIWPLSGIAHLA